MASFFNEIRRRKVSQVAGIYLVTAWLIMQVVDVVNEPLNLPDSFGTIVIVLLAIGFPLALLFSWVFDLTPHGVVRTPSTGDSTAGKSRGLETVLAALLVVALGWIAYRELGSTPYSPTSVLRNSVAVLPFENLSPNPDDAFFAAGIHEEILNQLTKLRNLSVISRTSVLRYKETKLTIPEIAAELHVQSVMEGSVRYAGDRVRIAAQLIDAKTDEHLWSEIYERDISDVFAIQADIAINIARALEAEFSLAERESIETPLTDSPQAYAAYLRAIASVADIAPLMDPQDVVLFHRNLDEAIAADPGFAQAHALKAFEYAFSAIRTYPLAAESGGAAYEALAREQAMLALQADPDLGTAHAALAILNMLARRGPEARAAFERAYELGPNDLNVIADYAVFLAQWGDYDRADELIRYTLEIAPNNPSSLAPAGYAYLLAGDYARAANANRAAGLIAPQLTIVYPLLGLAETGRGNSDDALDALHLAEQLLATVSAPDQLAQTAYAYGLLGRDDDAKRVFAKIGSLAEGYYVGPGSWAAAFLAIGDKQGALEWLERAAAMRTPDEGFIVLSILAANALSDPVLDEPAFRDVRARLGYRD